MSAISATPTQEWREIRADIYGTPDLLKPFSKLTIRPTGLRASWSRDLNPGDSPGRWRLGRVEVTGPRVLKGGKLGELTSDIDLWRRADRPQWLLDLLADLAPSDAGARTTTPEANGGAA